jgi:cytochrome bd-type quinol oxidase subunit 1
MAKFWGKLFLINFAIGVVTGVVQEFQFGSIIHNFESYVSKALIRLQRLIEHAIILIVPQCFTGL